MMEHYPSSDHAACSNTRITNRHSYDYGHRSVSIEQVRLYSQMSFTNKSDINCTLVWVFFVKYPSVRDIGIMGPGQSIDLVVVAQTKS